MSSAFDALRARKELLEAELAKNEKHIYHLEGAYLGAEYSQCGTVLKGFEGFLSSKDALRKRARNFKLEDRAFSLSSVTSPATSELQLYDAEAVDTNGVGLSSARKGPYPGKGAPSKGKR